MFNDSYAHKVKQLQAMIDFEYNQEESKQFGACLNHWAGTSKPINLDAEALRVLIDHYERMDEIEHYQAMKKQEESEHPEWKCYEYCIDTYACASFDVMAPDEETAREKAESFSETDACGYMYRRECEFFESTISYINKV